MDIEPMVLETTPSNNDELSKEQVILRREARKQKILNNAKNRLDMLKARGGGSGRGDGNNEVHGSEDNERKYSDPEVEPNIPSHISAYPARSTEFEALFGNANIIETPGQDSWKQKVQLIFKTKIPIMLATLIGFALSLKTFADSKNNFSIFLPAAMCIIFEFTFCRPQIKLSPFLTLLITLCGINSEKLLKITKYGMPILSFINDIGIVVFVYCTATFYLTYSNSYIGFSNFQ